MDDLAWSPDGMQDGAPIVRTQKQQKPETVEEEVPAQRTERVSEKTGMAKTDPPPGVAIHSASFFGSGLRNPRTVR